jgi:hypothetical protein
MISNTVHENKGFKNKFEEKIFETPALVLQRRRGGSRRWPIKSSRPPAKASLPPIGQKRNQTKRGTAQNVANKTQQATSKGITATYRTKKGINAAWQRWRNGSRRWPIKSSRPPVKASLPPSGQKRNKTRRWQRWRGGSRRWPIKSNRAMTTFCGLRMML